MYLKCITKNNITRLYFYESYYKDQKTRQRMVKGLGRLDELEKLYPNPVSHFTELAKNETDVIYAKKLADMGMAVFINSGRPVDGKFYGTWILPESLTSN